MKKAHKAADMVTEINNYIQTHGSRMTLMQHERLMELWDRAAIKNEDVRQELVILKGEIEKPSFRLFGGGRRAPQQRLNGFQMAAQKAGLPVNTPGLETMTFAEMCNMAEQQVRERIEPLREQNSGLYTGTKPVGKQPTQGIFNPRRKMCF